MPHLHLLIIFPGRATRVSSGQQFVNEMQMDGNRARCAKCDEGDIRAIIFAMIPPYNRTIRQTAIISNGKFINGYAF